MTGLFGRDWINKNYSLACLSIFLFFCSYHLLTPYLPQYFKQLHYEGSAIGFLMASFMFASLLIRPFCGKWSDEHSKNRLMMIGLGCFGIVVVFYALFLFWSPPTWLLFFTRFLQGVGFALFYTAISSYLVLLVPKAHKTEGISYYSNAIKCAMALAPALGMALIEKTGMLIPLLTSIGILSVVTLCTILLKPDTPTHHEPHPDTGLIEANVKRKGQLVHWPAIYPGVVMTTQSIVFGALIPFIPFLAQEKHFEQIGWVYTIYAVCLIFSRGFSGQAADRFGKEKILIPAMFMVTFTTCALALSQSKLIFYLTAGGYGFAAGCVQPALMAMASDSGKNYQQGAAMATFTLMTDLGIALGNILMGLWGQWWGFSNALLGIGYCTAIGIVVLVGYIVLSLLHIIPKPDPQEPSPCP